MSKLSWVNTFNAALTSQPDNIKKRLAILGIGNELSADDAAGVLAVRQLRARLKESAFSEYLTIIEAGPAPENFTAPLRRFKPDIVLLVDAVQMQAEPGQIAWLEWQQADGFSASTHTMPPTLLGKFLIEELNCQVFLLGVQVHSVEFDQPIHPAVKKAAARIAGQLRKLLLLHSY